MVPFHSISRLTRILFHSGAAGSALLLAGCSGTYSALDPAGPHAHTIAQLWWAMLLGAAILFVLVMGLFVLTLFRPGFGSGVSIKGWIVAGGLLLPIPVLVALNFYALFQGERLLPGDVASAYRIEAHARQWQWEFRYLDEPGAPSTVDVLHIPAGLPIEVVATSEDVIHSFWVPRLGGKIDATPGHAARIRIEADRPGIFGGVCAEYCGTGHSRMRFRVEAHEGPDFRSLVERGFEQ
ncbi:MAG: cytochrome c oxidase subunit II [Hoeflea sp.]|uniref:cytochrome c oxidase subunit II n=1 Tax=Hoeflea sp. TaxID=1940281 RepID=UPI001DBEC965|nr:cytochrome c oxidase subunit II [Hoeflea sp.]MBU4528085.1 cytochrome c oxidase subunit II [Alphaproteobacteria bacterium]MBU4543681.1 cytochrome c oxidase subunit II [Alphaproteobacteria bacterium]MBU4548548.1 cytochrome c oxidase subunit II [Alphaproteobacteria bacterium]MBV1725714.1 cytochrome c oxidase subunit II [Hoeflea sp.]MBV1762070.1 cytochrome c oxidase subunit II [Hoeflea sp.]